MVKTCESPCRAGCLDSVCTPSGIARSLLLAQGGLGATSFTGSPEWGLRTPPLDHAEAPLF